MLWGGRAPCGRVDVAPYMADMPKLVQRVALRAGAWMSRPAAIVIVKETTWGALRAGAWMSRLLRAEGMQHQLPGSRSVRARGCRALKIL